MGFGKLNTLPPNKAYTVVFFLPTLYKVSAYVVDLISNTRREHCGLHTVDGSD